MAVKTAVMCLSETRLGCLSSFAADTSSKLNVLGHDGHSLGVDSTQVGVLEESNKVGLTGFLKGHDGGTLETQIGLEILGNFTH